MSTDLVTLTPEQYPVLAAEQGASVAAVIRRNLGGEKVTPADLNRVKVPAGGGTIWEVTGADGETEAMKELVGVIVSIQRRRAYWPDAKTTGEPPACASNDCENGVGHPGGKCEGCPMNDWATAMRPDGTAGRGKACKESKLYFLLREGQLLPDVVQIPPASLKATKQYQLKLGNVPYFGVITKLTLARQTSKDGKDYASVVPRRVGTLSPETAKGMLEYATELASVFDAVGIEDEDDGDGPVEV